jgi:DNA-binding NarL/FixJ family response regulator
VAAMRVALADDSSLFRSGLAALLTSARVEVALEAGSGEELLTRLQGVEPPPQVVILDMRMPPSFTDEGLRTALSIRERFSDMGILVLSTYADPTSAARLLESASGAVGYVLKDRVDNLTVLLDVLHRIVRGETVIEPELVRRLLERRRATSVLDELSAREREILDQMAQGRSNAGIARLLHLSVKTVERHIAGLLMRLDLPPEPDDNRRVLAVLTWLRSVGPSAE